MTITRKCYRCRTDKQRCKRPQSSKENEPFTPCERCAKYKYECSEDLAPGEKPQQIQEKRLQTHKSANSEHATKPGISTQSSLLATSSSSGPTGTLEYPARFLGLINSTIGNLPETGRAAIAPPNSFAASEPPPTPSTVALPRISPAFSQLPTPTIPPNNGAPMSLLNNSNTTTEGTNFTFSFHAELPDIHRFPENSHNGRDEIILVTENDINSPLFRWPDVRNLLYNISVQFSLGGSTDLLNTLKTESRFELVFKFTKTIESVPPDTGGLGRLCGLMLAYISLEHKLQYKLPKSSGESTIFHDIFACLGSSTFPALQWMVKETRLVAALGAWAISSDFTIQDNTGATPLHTANIHYLCLESLLPEHIDAIAKAVNTQDNEGRLPLHFEQNDFKTFELFVQLLQVKSLESPSKSTPLSILFTTEQEKELRKQHLWNIDEIGSIEKKLEILRKYNILTNLTNQPCEKQPNILHYLVNSDDYPASVRLLVRGQYSLVVDSSNESGDKPLHITTKRAFELSLSFENVTALSNCYTLVVHGNANVDCLDSRGRTPALLAVLHVVNRLDAVGFVWEMEDIMIAVWVSTILIRLFIMNQANLDIEDQYGMSARKAAKEAWKRWNRLFVFDSESYDDYIDTGGRCVEIMPTLDSRLGSEAQTDIYQFFRHFDNAYKRMEYMHDLDETIHFLKQKLRFFVEMISKAGNTKSVVDAASVDERQGVQPQNTSSRKRKRDSLSDEREEQKDQSNE